MDQIHFLISPFYLGMETKICTKCKEEKTLNNFNKDKTRKCGYQYKCISCIKQYRNKNPHLRREYNISNKDVIKKYYEKNKEKFSKDAKIWKKNNKEKVKIIKSKYYHKKYNSDPLYKLKLNIRNRIRESVNNFSIRKKFTTQNILGCTFEEFKLHLESKFKPWMNWENKGNPKDGIYEPNKTWDIDHIIPLSNAKTEEEIYKLNHYTNLQPLCSYKNRFVKRDKF